MFEHLGYIPDIKNSKPKTNYKVYLSFLLFGVMVFLFAFATGKGPSSMAQTYVSPDVKVLVNSADRQVVVSSPQFLVFDFIIKTEKEGVSLEKLKVSTTGLFDVDLFSDLKLYNNDTQMGSVLEIDQDGNIYFVLDNYQLEKGDNFFSFALSSNKNIKAGNVLSLGFDDNTSIFLSYQGKLFNAKGDFPINGGLVNIIEQGSLQAFKAFDNSNFYIDSNTPNVLNSFYLVTDAEPANLKKIVFRVEDSEGILENIKFALLDDEKLIGESYIQDGQIIFDIAKYYKLNASTRNYFELHVLNLPAGSFDFVLAEVQAKGVFSGKDNLLVNTLDLGLVQAIDFMPKFYVGELQESLSEGWNTLYDVQIKSRNSDVLFLNKLTWSFESQGVHVDKAQVWVNDQPYVCDIVIKDNTITMKTGWDEALDVSANSDIKLLVKVSGVDKGDYIKADILTDKKPEVADDFSDHILWSHGEDIFNGYQLPYLPLDPSVLSN